MFSKPKPAPDRGLAAVQFRVEVERAITALAEAERHARTRTMSPPTAAPYGPCSGTPSDPGKSP